jgi:hypothetical protein
LRFHLIKRVIGQFVKTWRAVNEPIESASASWRRSRVLHWDISEPDLNVDEERDGCVLRVPLRGLEFDLLNDGTCRATKTVPVLLEFVRFKVGLMQICKETLEENLHVGVAA